MKYDFDRINEVARAHLGLLYPLDKHHKGIVCPLCGNGQGKDGDGVTFIKNTPVLKCFRCGFVGDVIKLTQLANSMSSYVEAAKVVAEKLGMTDGEYQRDSQLRTDPFTIPKFDRAREEFQEEKVDQTDYFKKVEKFLYKTDYPTRRGLSQETCKEFQLGFDQFWKHPKVPKAPTSPRLIIPTSQYSYLARDTREDLTDTQKRYSKQKFGSVAIFNSKALDYEFAFVTEGEIDAISFFEVSKQYAVALGSVSNIQKLVDDLKTRKKKPHYMVAALDNDVAGREGNLKLKQALEEIGIHTLIADFIYTDVENKVEYKDANEILVKNREAFIDNINAIWKIPIEYYGSDKPASQIIAELNAKEEAEAARKNEPYSDEELSEMIKEPEFTAEDIQSMFENTKFSQEELEQMASRDNPQPVGLEKVKKSKDFYPFIISNNPETNWKECSFPTLKVKLAMDENLLEMDPKELKVSQDLLNSMTEFNNKTVYDAVVLWALAYCMLCHDEETCRKFEVNCLKNHMSIVAISTYVFDLMDRFAMWMNDKYWHSEKLDFPCGERDTIVLISPLASPSSSNQLDLFTQKVKALADLKEDFEESVISTDTSESSSIPSEQIAPKNEDSATSIARDTEVPPENLDEPMTQTSQATTTFSEVSEAEKTTADVSESSLSSSSEEVPSVVSKQVLVTENEESATSIARDAEVPPENLDELTTQTSRAATTSSEVPELEKAKKLLSSITEFTNETVFASETLQAAAYCKVYSPFELVTFLERCRENKIKITLLNDYIKQIAVPIAKIKRREDKHKEQARFAEETKKKHEEFKTIRYNNSVKMETLLNQPQSPERDRKLIDLIQKSLERDHTGKVKSTSVTNFELALYFDPIIRGCVGYDAFSQKIVPRRELPWTDKLNTQTTWANYDDAGLQNYLNRTYELNNERIFFNVISEYAHKNSFHPIRDYFNGLPAWDGVTRAAEYFIENLEIEDDRYSREVIKHWMMAAVARVFHPGCKWDYTLVIKGEQGIGKSTVFSKLAGKWFNDSIETIGGKETLENLLGSWIIELCEMQATKKAENEIIKSFLSRQTDRFRVPYGRRTEEFLRQCVFAATTNDEEFLKDRTGNRRFLVLVSKAQDDNCRDRLSKLGAEYIDQIWAEIFYRYNQLFPANETFDSSKLLPDSDVLEMAKNIREDYVEGSGLEGMIGAYLEMKIPTPDQWETWTMLQRRDYIQNYTPSSVQEGNDSFVSRNIVSAVEVAYELLRVDNPSKERGTLREIVAVLSRIKGWNRVTWRRRGIYGQQRVAYERQFETPPGMSATSEPEVETLPGMSATSETEGYDEPSDYPTGEPEEDDDKPSEAELREMYEEMREEEMRAAREPKIEQPEVDDSYAFEEMDDERTWKKYYS